MNIKNKLWVRILAWMLAILMVVSIAYFTGVMIAEQIRETQESQQESTTGGSQSGDDDHDDHEGHDHD